MPAHTTLCNGVAYRLQEHSELTAGPAPAKSPAKLSSPSAKPSPAGEKHGGASPGTSPPANMNRTVLDVAARRQELLDREVSATSWKVSTTNAGPHGINRQLQELKCKAVDQAVRQQEALDQDVSAGFCKVAPRGSVGHCVDWQSLLIIAGRGSCIRALLLVCANMPCVSR